MERKEKIVLDGNSFYSIDLSCVENKEQKKKTQQNRTEKEKKGRR